MPAIWGKQVIDEYNSRKSKPPSFIKSNIRHFKNGTIFTNDQMGKSYNMYEVDIAVAKFYFDKSTIFQYVRQPRQSWIDFLGNIGGLLGLCLGVSIVTIIEMFWLLIRIANQIMLQEKRR